MIRNLLSIGIFFLFFSYAYAQCPAAPIILSRQSQVDSFRVLYPNCKDLRSTLRIGFELEYNLLTEEWYCPSFTDITHLDSLLGIKSVFGFMDVQCNSVLSRLYGLDSMQSVRRSLRIEGNDNLRSIENFPILNTIGESLRVNEKNINKIELPSIRDSILDISLSSKDTLRAEFLSRIKYTRNLSLDGPLILDGILNLNRVDVVRVSNNPLRTDLACFNNSKLENISVLSIISCQNLGSFQGLPKIDSMRHLFIRDCPLDPDFLGSNSSIKLANLSLSAIPNMVDLQRIKDVVISFHPYFYDNPNLVSLDGLNPKTTIRGCLYLDGNPELTNISALDQISFFNISCIGWGIRNNPKLEVCNYPILCNFIENNPGRLTIRNNAPGCNSEAEILEACALVSTEDVSDTPQASISLYPNPAHDWVMIRGVADLYSVRLLDMMGRQLRHSSSDRIDLTDLDAGMYVVQIERADGSRLTKKLIKK